MTEPPVARPSSRAGGERAAVPMTCLRENSCAFISHGGAVGKLLTLTLACHLSRRLQSGPRGAYTVARTVGLTSVFELDFHVQRLAKSASLMLEGDGAAAPAGSELEACCDAARLHTRIVDAWGECVRAMGPSGAKELKLSALLSWDVATGAAELRAHAAPLPSRPPHPVRAIVRGAPRSNAEAKDSAWIAARAGLDAVGKAAGANEVVLVDGNGDLLEGLSSNFYAVEADGALVTAEEGVLKGTVRDVALRACEREGVPVRLRPPRLADARSWKGCLVSSTSRLALPVDELVYEVAASGEEVTVKFDYSSETGDDTALKVEALVLGDMAANSQPVIE